MEKLEQKQSKVLQLVLLILYSSVFSLNLFPPSYLVAHSQNTSILIQHQEHTFTITSLLMTVLQIFKINLIRFLKKTPLLFVISRFLLLSFITFHTFFLRQFLFYCSSPFIFIPNCLFTSLFFLPLYKQLLAFLTFNP